MPPCTTFSRNLGNFGEKGQPCSLLASSFLSLREENTESGNNNTAVEPRPSFVATLAEEISENLGKKEEANTLSSSSANKQDLVALSEGSVIRIFEASKSTGFTPHKCSHTLGIISPLKKELKRIAAESKSEAGPLHVCLTCQRTFNGERGRLDMEDHFEVSGHSLTMCVDDLSFWCFECDHSVGKHNCSKLAAFFNGLKELMDEGVDKKPTMDCPHAQGLLDFKNVAIDMNAVCQHGACSHSEDNMVCLSCGYTFCGKNSQEHMKHHCARNPTHTLSISLSDLSIWCSDCSRTIDYHASADLYDIHTLFTKKKFGLDKPKKRKVAEAPKQNLDFIDLERLLKKQKVNVTPAVSVGAASIESWDPKYNVIIDEPAHLTKAELRRKQEDMFDMILRTCV